MTDVLFDEIYKFSRILNGIDIPYWVIDEKTGKDVLFEYPPGYKQRIQKKLDQLCQQWQREHPYDVLNGGRQ